MATEETENLTVPAATAEGDRDAASRERSVLDSAVWDDVGGRTDNGTCATDAPAEVGP